MQLEFPGAWVSITLSPGGFHESSTQEGSRSREVGHPEAVSRGEGADLGPLRPKRPAAQPDLPLADATLRTRRRRLRTKAGSASPTGREYQGSPDRPIGGGGCPEGGQAGPKERGHQRA